MTKFKKDSKIKKLKTQKDEEIDQIKNYFESKKYKVKVGG